MTYTILADKVYKVKLENCEHLTEHDKKQVASLLVLKEILKKQIKK